MVWEQRWHPLREEWVIVAAHRQSRPWYGEKIRHPEKEISAYDPDCYLCPGNKRSGGAVNEKYTGIFVFDNDHPCVGWPAPEVRKPVYSVYKNSSANGIARVVCYSPQHNLTLTELKETEIVNLLKVWREQYRELGTYEEIRHVLIFENKGKVVGVSNPHPHCQIYATNFIFKHIATEAKAGAAYFRENHRVLFQDILQAEQNDGRRIIAENDSAIAFIPYFARYAYEVFVAPKETHPALTGLAGSELLDFAGLLKRVLIKFDNLWHMPFPYVMVLHQAPVDGADNSTFHFHVEFHPPLRQPGLLKYLAGPEIGGGNFLSDTSPEEKAAELRSQPDIYYKKVQP